MAAVSVIITTYNRPELLKETIDSILAQTFIDFELIVVDNFSTYDFFELIAGYKDPRIKAYQNANNGVIAVNRNFGVRVAEADLIAFCDDDDLWLADKLEKQLVILSMKKRPALVCTGCSFIGITSQSGIRGIPSLFLQKMLSINLVPGRYILTAVSYITNSSVLFDKKILDDVGMLNEDPNMRTVEDYDLWIRISMKYPVYYTAEKLVKYRVHTTQVSHTEETKEKTRSVLSRYNSRFDIIQKAIVYVLR